MSVELEIWREACRHIDIEESLERMAPVLAREFPIGHVYLRRLDRTLPHLLTVAATSRLGRVPRDAARTELSRAQLSTLEDFLSEGRVRTLPSGEQTLRPLVVPEGIHFTGEVLAGPLTDGEGHDAVLVIAGRSDEIFQEAHVQLAQSLLDPFTVALGNDRRLHELARLREAAEADNRALRSRLHVQPILDPIVGAQGGLRVVLERVRQVASTDAPVLILGETGSGKEVIARTLHEQSRRAEGPIVRVNCGAIPTELVDSELFGHEKGSFTGAIATRKGWFERADGGTLFLDEVGELPLAAQVRLLRVLQDGTIERVGGQRPIHVDVRIVAATHRDLQAMVADGRFRSDLWYRISVFPLRLPALRERLEDLPELVDYFARKAGERLGNPALTASPADLEVLRAYSWPGNVRELASVVERATILGHARKLEIALALGVGAPIPTAPIAAPAAPIANVAELDDAMVKHIERALAQTGGRIEGAQGAAALLNINPHTLRARMRKLGVDWARFRAR